MTASRTLGAVANSRGHQNEERVLASAVSAPNRLSWVRGARAADHREDALGIDVVVFSELGDLYLQVKSSYAGAASWMTSARTADRRRARMIEVVVAHVDTKVMAARVDGALWRLRKRIEEHRG